MKTMDKTMTLTLKDGKLLDVKENDIKAVITNPYGEPKDIHDQLKAGDYVIFARLDKLNRVLISCTTIIKVNNDEVTVEDDVSRGNDFLTASEKCLGTETSYQWIEASKNSDIYGDVTINKFPVGTYIALKDVYTYYLEISSQPDTVKAGDAIKWVPMTTEFTIPDDHVVYALRVWNQKTGTCKLVYVQGTPGTKATEHTGSIEEGTTEKPRIFSDVPNDAWYQPYVVHCYQSNIMNQVLLQADQWY